ncbi:Lrp/AsnC family transcriptional regulator [Candidatus Woesearchaeota archaeon]|nr:MAG: hypothetical protein QS99_C0001G0133 [archaeon GW2011_AR4]MBS3129344.1 Lrp/AsnC family transcriptional regulator [Candidatus Woesearchaeota archaeon]HIH38647.1 Lrp/AsnC family transcriptional regulator [Candidatus Woesearchaeota archaeon]HIH49413.1 Lrp/AsnC family transcriptional regulator [Candidatus Woesearchaeota archaeon]HIJ02851.1 Lrp/AsnC family transcriptional regulator [Candidatus Woesearchaeota archaeon]
MVKIDYDLIYLLSENSRMKLKDLSKYLKKSPQRLKYAISMVEKEGLITDANCLFDYGYFGSILFRAYFRGGYISDQQKVQIVKDLETNPYIISIYDLTGEYDLAVEFAAPNPSKFNKELKKLIAFMPTLSDYKLILNLVSHIYPRQYLTKSPALQNMFFERIIGGDRDIETFNQNELIIIKALLDNPTMRMTDLSEKSGLNVKTVNVIMKNLIKRNVVKEFKYVIDSNKLGINRSRLFLKLHYLTSEREEKLLYFASKTKEIVQLHKTVGDWDMELDIESLDKNKVRSIIMEIRAEFKDVIERFNVIEVYSYFKRTYLPRYLFEDLDNKKNKSR